MAKTISTNSRNAPSIALLHLFEFHMDKNFDGDSDDTNEILYFTDHDIFVDYDGNEYTPLSITFNSLVEDLTMSSNSINLSIDNINGDLSAEALASEWRGNKAKITRIIYSYNGEAYDGEWHEFGATNVDSVTEYPKIDFNNIFNFDSYLLFDGVIDTFSATEQSLQATINTQFVHWSKPFPTLTYNQNAFK